MTSSARHGVVLCLLGIACMADRTRARAESAEDSRKRSFAERLARRAETRPTVKAGAGVAAPRVGGRPAGIVGTARSSGAAPGVMPSTSPFFPAMVPRVADANGVSSATPVTPSGYGAGRDGFVQALYVQILGRGAMQWEVDYWSRKLARGISANAVATLIWDSPEHRSLIRMNEAPGIPLRKAYHNALAYGNAQR